MIMQITPYFVFDVESIGLHGEPFAVGWTVTDGTLTDDHPTELDYGLIAIEPSLAAGTGDDRQWCVENIPPMPVTHLSMKAMLVDFWSRWMHWKAKGAVMWSECGWPVEAKFLAMCVHVDYPKSKWDGPYPLHDVVTAMLCAGMDPMASYDRTVFEQPKHHPLSDARQSARLLMEAWARLLH